MNKILLSTMFLLLATVSFGRTPTVGNIWNVSDYNGTYGADMDTAGNVDPMTTNVQSLGDSSYKWDAVLNDMTADNATITNPTITDMISMHESWTNPPAASSKAVSTILITTATCPAGVYTLNMANITQHFPGRIIGVSFDTDTESTATVTFSGYNTKGAAISESVTCVLGKINYTSNAFSVIDTSPTVTFTNGTAAATLWFNVATGVKLGLCGNIDSATDIYLIKENATGIRYNNSSILVDTTYDTVDFVTDPAGNSIEIWYRSDSN